MKKLFLAIVSLACSLLLYPQQPGDTILVSAFKYSSTSRDTVLHFPPGNLSFEKIIMKYNMRCKNALVSTQTAPNQGCGEWDYSCNTFIVDSSKIEEVLSTHPSHTISNFSGGPFSYTSSPIYDYYRYRQTTVGIDSILSESQAAIGLTLTPIGQLLKTDERSGRTQLIYKAAELMAAGFSAGPIDGIMLEVANAGGTAHFLKIGFQHTNDSILHASAVALSGFTNVFNHTFHFIQGNNRIQFHTPFIWDGSSNLLIELSFTNTVPNSPIILDGHNTTFCSALYANNNYALDLSASGLAHIDATHLGTISNEITMSFWSYGYPVLPINTTILYGYAGAANERQFNVHLPWGNGSIYFDCGFSGGYDRIEKAALASEYKGQWNHWAFTKNASTGSMNMYLNGSLWQSGTGKTKTISIQHLLLGNNSFGTSNYKGKINELAIWDKALSQQDIQTWKNKSLDPSHPWYSNLMAYYKMTEGNGLTIHDSKNSMASSGTDLQWTYNRGHQLDHQFTEHYARPQMVFLRGSYILDTTTVFEMDSVCRNPNIVKAYTITAAPVGTLKDDSLTLVSTSTLYQALPQNIMDGDMDTLISTIAVIPEDSIQITTLNYYKRYPYYNEIMSFVTPYGKGLDLGVNGKTWYFDVTDFKPILKDKKRFMMTGGIWQEDLDIDFLFIVGTPPRDVLEFNQLWQGYARAGEASIASINNNTRFAPVSIPLLSTGQQFKIRATITGHGSEGEFHQNGGIVNHYFSVNSSINNFTWQITEECSMNPVFPQGGTWVYDRQGWCPGQYSLTKELDITPLVSPGTSVSLDYNCSSPIVATGDYRYLAAFQLVTYGGANHSLDAHLVDVLAPTNKIVYARKNPICANPVILVQNTGSTPVTSIEVSYWLNNATTNQTYTWTGNLNYMDTTSIKLPIGSLWDHDFQASGNIFNAALTKVNNAVDDYPQNNHFRSPFEVTEKIPGEFIMEFRTNNYPTHNSYLIYDDNGNVVPGASNFVTPNIFYRDTFNLDGCYTLVVWDLGGDGVQWWANPAQGTGAIRLKDMNGLIFKVFQPDFGGGFEYSFTTLGPTSISEFHKDIEITIFPNPAQDQLYVTGANIEFGTIAFQDMLGRSFTLPIIRSQNTLEIDTRSLPRGIYFVSIIIQNQRVVKKVVIN